MKLSCFSLLAALGVMLAVAGCGSIDVSTGGSPDRVVTGSVNAGGVLPAGTEVLVRLVAPLSSNEPVRPQGNDLPVTSRAAPQASERVLGEQTQKLTSVALEPVSFRIEYNADDATLRRGLNVDVRVSVNGKLRFRTINAHVVTLASSPFKQEVAVQAVSGN